MSGFSYSGGGAASGAGVAVIVNDGWFPDIALQDVREEQRIPDNITMEQLRAVTVAAILSVGNELRSWQAAHAGEGRARLLDVPAPRIDGRTRFEILYLRAVAAYAKADLVERYRDVDFTAAGHARADRLSDAVGELRRDAIHAVRDILGRTRTDVELI